MVVIDQRTFLPIINYYVSVPDINSTTRVPLATALSTISGSYVSTFDHHGRRLFVLPDFDRWNGYTADWFAQLRAVAS
jgi:hypothetical protein